MRIFDRSDIGTHATEVTTKVYELRHPNPNDGHSGTAKGHLAHRGSANHSWTEYDPTVGGTPPDLTLTASPGRSGLNTTAGDPLASVGEGGYFNHVTKEGSAHQATRHDWYVALSASPTTIGSKTNYGLYFTLEYI